MKSNLRILDKANEEAGLGGSPSDALSDRRSVADCPISHLNALARKVS